MRKNLPILLNEIPDVIKVSIVLFTICTIFYIVQIGSFDAFVFRPQSEFSDLTITFWPNIYYLKQNFLDNRSIALWRTLIFSGSPLDSDPQSGLWYFPNIIFLLFPINVGFNILILLHLVFGGVGVWIWSSMLGASKAGATISALIFVFLPKVFAHLGFGHLGLVYGSSYIPWVFLTIEKISRCESKAWVKYGLALGSQFLASPHLGLFTGCVSLIMYTLNGLCGRSLEFSFLRKKQQWTDLFLAGLYFLFIAGVLLVPMLRFAPLSSRSTMGLLDSAISSLPPKYLWGLLIADHHGYMEYMVYIGILPLLLGLISIGTRHGKIGFVIVVVCFLFALGINTPLYAKLFQALPFLAWLRSPARLLFIAFAIIAVNAGIGFDQLGKEIPSRFLHWVKRFLLIAGLLPILLLLGLVVLRAPLNLNFYVFGFGFPTVMLFTFLVITKRVSRQWQFFGCLILILCDLWIIDASLIEGKSYSQQINNHSPGSFLRNTDAAHFRVYSPSYSISRLEGAIFQIESADGVDPLYSSDYDLFMQSASGVSRSRYEVTIPAMENDLPVSIVNKFSTPNPSLLGVLNVKYVIAEFKIEHSFLTRDEKVGSSYIYRNEKYLPRYYIIGSTYKVTSIQEAIDKMSSLDLAKAAVVEDAEEISLGNPNGSISVITEKPDLIELSVKMKTKGLLVISQNWHPDWKVWVDGAPGKIIRTNGTISGVLLDQGNHQVRLQYKPLTTYICLLITLVAYLFGFISILWRRLIFIRHIKTVISKYS